MTVLTENEIEGSVELDDNDNSHYDDYYCIQVRPFKCHRCQQWICYAVAGEHLILIWENNDEDSILGLANVLKKDGNYDPIIIKYNRLYGPCIEYEEALEKDILDYIT